MSTIYNAILPYWKLNTPEVAKESSEKIYEIFLKSLENNDFVGADIVRKYLQMGFTRSTHYTADIFSKNGKKQKKIKNIKR